jgi:outer membrane immunogenic protein
MRKLFLLVAASTALATPALAQTSSAPHTGLRVEGLIGYDRLSDGGDQDSSSSSGIVYGGGVGYDIPLGSITLGAEAELTGSTVDTRTDSLLVAGDRLRLDAGRDIYVGGRVGFPITPATLLYAKGGYTNARVEARYDAGATSVDDHADLDGFRLGAGVEQSLGTNTYVKAEYRYSHYSKVDDYDIDADRHQLVAGVGIRF